MRFFLLQTLHFDCRIQIGDPYQCKCCNYKQRNDTAKKHQHGIVTLCHIIDARLFVIYHSLLVCTKCNKMDNIAVPF